MKKILLSIMALSTILSLSTTENNSQPTAESQEKCVYTRLNGEKQTIHCRLKIAYMLKNLQEEAQKESSATEKKEVNKLQKQLPSWLKTNSNHNETEVQQTFRLFALSSLIKKQYPSLSDTMNTIMVEQYKNREPQLKLTLYTFGLVAANNKGKSLHMSLDIMYRNVEKEYAKLTRENHAK